MSALCQKQTFPPYSITSSAMLSRLGGTTSASIRAVERLITSSNLLDAMCQKQKSAVNFAKYDVERAEYRRDISEHVPVLFSVLEGSDQTAFRAS
jgi:hypothetical protein